MKDQWINGPFADFHGLKEVVNQLNPRFLGLFRIIFNDLQIIAQNVMNSASETLMTARNDRENTRLSLIELCQT